MNELSRSVFRQSFLLRMIAIEADYQIKLGARGKAKYELNKMVQAVNSGFKNIKHELKISGDVFEKELVNSEEKINAIHNVITALADMPEKDVIDIENVIFKNK